MDKATKEYIREEVERLFSYSLDCFNMSDIIECSDRLTPKQKEWAKNNTTWRIVIEE